MMNKQFLKRKNKKILIPFLTCGDPNLEVTKELVYAFDEAGVDSVMLGIPFSDPTAEAGIIQEAYVRALNNGTTTDLIFDMVAEIRKTSDVTLCFMTYANVVFSYGIEKFVKKMADCKISALFLQDVPHEEKDEFEDVCTKYGVAWIQMACSTYANCDNYRRLINTAETANGFIYCTHVTGVKDPGHEDLKEMVAHIRNVTEAPCVIECASTSSEEVKFYADATDGIIIGPQIVELCRTFGDSCVSEAKAFAEKIISAIN